jgi:putative glycosyltransferase (TIGR04372 family)
LTAPPRFVGHGRTPVALGHTLAVPVVGYVRKIAAERRASRTNAVHAVASVVARSFRWRVYRAKESRLLKMRLMQAEARRIEARAAKDEATGEDLARLGDLEFHFGEIADACRWWSRAVDLDPEQIEVFERHAYVLWERGYWDEAFERFERAIEAQEALARRQQLDQLPISLIEKGFTFAIGTLAFLDTYVKQRMLAGVPLDRTVLLPNPWKVGNQSYLDYWRRYLPNYICNLEAYDNTFLRLRRLLKLHHMAWRHPDGRLLSFQQAGVEAEEQWEVEGRKPLLQLTEAHRERGWEALRQVGLDDDAWFVALHVREDWYHDARNADISTYFRAFERIVERGGWVIRMGDTSMPPLPPLTHVIDYAHSPIKSDWMDVFLWAECRFLIGTTSGPVAIPGTFGVPAVHTNWCPLGLRYWYSSDLCLPKRYQKRGGSRPLSFEEVISSRLGFVMRSEDLAELNAEVVDNTPAEIEAIVLEMLDRVEDEAAYTFDDERLQEQFQRIQPQFRYPAPGGRVRMGRDYLRANASLLGA